MYNNNEITTQRSVKYETNPINSEFTGISIWLTLYCMVPTENVLSLFHPLIREWFQRRYGEPTEVQRKAWPVIAEGRHILMTAPTGSGKTLSAFLWGLNQLITERWTTGRVRILYISPLRALNNDIRINLRGPLSDLREQFLHTGEPFPEIGVQTRSGDTPPAERQRMLRRPPEILITTPESLNILLSSMGGRAVLNHIETVILDEIHAVASNKRGTHLITAVERLVPLSGEFQRIALSATIKPFRAIADFIGGFTREGDGKALYRNREVSIVKAAGSKRYEMQVCSPADAERVQGPDAWWQSFVTALRGRIDANRATLLFANSRRFTEKLTRLINAEDRGDVRTAYSHHGSLSREIRHLVENKLKRGELRSIVATSSLELGIDIGELDEVVLVQAPYSVSSALQRVGRAGHGVREVSRARLYPLFSRDYLNGAVIARAVMEGDIEETRIPLCPLDVLAQIVVSMTAVETLSAEDLYDFIRTSYSYRDLRRDQFDLVLQMLAGRYEETRIRELRPRISIDPLSGVIRSREGSLGVLYMAGGTIPDRGYYSLRVQDSGAKIGELDEEFVWERSVGDVFSFGTQQWRVTKIDHQNVEVVPASRQASMAPFWKADLSGRDFHLSEKIALFLEEMDGYKNLEDAAGMLSDRYFMDEASVRKLLDFLGDQRRATGTGLPHRHQIIAEHIAGLEDRSDSRQVVVHAIWGGKVIVPYVIALGQAWEERYGSTLRMYHDNDTILMSLPAGADTHPLQGILTLVTPDNVERLLRKKLERTGIFGARFRQNAARSLLLPKRGFNRRTPLWINRIRARKLLHAVYDYADFPVLTETWRTCLWDEFDMGNLKALLQELEQNDISIVDAYPASPSPFAAEIIHWQTHTHMYEDDTPGLMTESGLREDILKDAVFTSSLRPRISEKLIHYFVGRLDRTAPGYTPDSAEDLYDWVTERILLPLEEAERLVSAMVRDHGTDASGWLGKLADRVVEIYLPSASCRSLMTLENMQRVLEALFIPGEEGEDRLSPLAAEWLRYYGPVHESYLAEVWGVGLQRLSVIVETLLEERSIVRDRFRDGTDTVEVCDAENMESLLRMVRRKGRREFSALPLRMLPLFLARHQQLIPSSRVEESEETGGDDPVDQQRHLQQCLEILFGYPAKAESWEYDIFPARMKSYMPGQLDLLFQQSDLIWFGTGGERLSFCFSSDREMYLEPNTDESGDINRIFPDRSGKYGYWDMHRYAGMDHRKLSEHVWGLVWKGLLSNDRFEPVRRGITAGYTDFLEMPSPGNRHGRRHRFNRWQASHPLSGNWYVLNPDPLIPDLMHEEELSRDRVRQLLARYGVLFRELLQHELPQLRWGRVFRSLRIMELSGEVLAGYFFEDIPGLQFASHTAFQEFGQPVPTDAVYWMNATDPASLCGVRIEGIDLPLPRRVNSNYLVFRGERLVLALGRSGREVTVYVPPEDEGIPVYLRVFHALLNRPVNPVAQIRVDSINEKPALESAFLDHFVQFGFVKGYRGLLLRRGYR